MVFSGVIIRWMVMVTVALSSSIALAIWVLVIGPRCFSTAKIRVGRSSILQLIALQSPLQCGLGLWPTEAVEVVYGVDYHTVLCN